MFDPLSRLGELTKLSHSTPSSPRLLPRRHRDVGGASFDMLESGPSRGSDGNGVNWRDRCFELQLELQRSRAQATRSRDMLREKVSHVLDASYYGVSLFNDFTELLSKSISPYRKTICKTRGFHWRTPTSLYFI